LPSGEACKTTEGREDINWWLKEIKGIDLAGVLIMGSVKPSYIKNFAMDLLRTYETSFSPDFEQNKLKVSEYTDIKNKNIRNRVAGYISNVMRQRSSRRGEVEIDV
jgi:small subunit ribosomal protein S17e